MRTLHVLALSVIINSSGLSLAQSADDEWPVYLGGKQRNLYSRLEQINRQNVSQLELAWTFETGEEGEYQANNLVVNGVLYTPRSHGRPS
jgi:quinoprotein glucose dehydrogenase